MTSVGGINDEIRAVRLSVDGERLPCEFASVLPDQSGH